MTELTEDLNEYLNNPSEGRALGLAIVIFLIACSGVLGYWIGALP